MNQSDKYSIIKDKLQNRNNGKNIPSLFRTEAWIQQNQEILNQQNVNIDESLQFKSKIKGQLRKIYEISPNEKIKPIIQSKNNLLLSYLEKNNLFLPEPKDLKIFKEELLKQNTDEVKDNNKQIEESNNDNNTLIQSNSTNLQQSNSIKNEKNTLKVVADQNNSNNNIQVKKFVVPEQITYNPLEQEGKLKQSKGQVKLRQKYSNSYAPKKNQKQNINKEVVVTNNTEDTKQVSTNIIETNISIINEAQQDDKNNNENQIKNEIIIPEKPDQLHEEINQINQNQVQDQQADTSKTEQIILAEPKQEQLVEQEEDEEEELDEYEEDEKGFDLIEIGKLLLRYADDKAKQLEQEDKIIVFDELVPTSRQRSQTQKKPKKQKSIAVTQKPNLIQLFTNPLQESVDRLKSSQSIAQQGEQKKRIYNEDYLQTQFIKQNSEIVSRLSYLDVQSPTIQSPYIIDNNSQDIDPPELDSNFSSEANHNLSQYEDFDKIQHKQSIQTVQDDKQNDVEDSTQPFQNQKIQEHNPNDDEDDPNQIEQNNNADKFEEEVEEDVNSDQNIQEKEVEVSQGIQIIQTNERHEQVRAVMQNYEGFLSDIIDIIYNINSGLLEQKDFDLLLTLTPNQDELNELQKCNENTIFIDEENKLIYDIYNIPFFQERLQFLVFEPEFQNCFAQIKQNLEVLDQGCQQLKKNTEMQEFYETIKDFLIQNTETFNGISANQISILDLEYLVDFENENKDQTVFTQILKDIKEYERDLIKFVEKLQFVNDIVAINIQKDYNQAKYITQTIRTLNENLDQKITEENCGDKYCVVFENFLKENEDIFDFEEFLNQLIIKIEEVSKIFGSTEEPNFTIDMFQKKIKTISDLNWVIQNIDQI